MAVTLTIKTDKPLAELCLFSDHHRIDCLKWEAHLKLAETLHKQIDQLLSRNNLKINDIGSVIVYSGPGSFTGLRIGVAVANAISYSLGIKVVGSNGEDWINKGLDQQKTGLAYATINYGSEAKTTSPKK